ncbi:MAG: hypothetical protein GY943_12125, partial [Chloroflexi bacterium]|nr:hypothetical protein [Chloroflexota bacterium]
MHELIDIIHLQRPHLERKEITSDFHFETLLEALVFLFSEEEIRTLSFELGIDYESLPAIGKVAKATEFVCDLNRRDNLHKLIKLCQDKRPFLDNWEQLVVSCPRFTRRQIRMAIAVFVILVAAGIFWVWWPPPLSDGFNVVVAEFGEVDENGRVRRSD